jgi:uncharacterized protein involved in cysteine biosynthesis
MRDVIASIAKALGQLGDPAIRRVLAKSVGVTLLIFAACGVALYYALVWVFAEFGVAAEGMAGAAGAVILALIAFWFLFRVVALAVLQLFADEVVIAVEQRHYAAAASAARPLPLAHDLANSLRGIVRALAVNALALPFALALLLTGVGAALVFLVVNAWLLGRELTDMAWLRHCGDDPRANPVPAAKRFAIGGVIAALMLVPFVSFLAPVIGAAAGTHLLHRVRERR